MKFSQELIDLAYEIPDYEPKKPNVNILYFSDTYNKEYYNLVKMLDENNVNYVPILMHERMVDEEFVKLLLEFSPNGFDDIVRKTYFNTLYPNLIYNEVKFNRMVNIIVNNYVDILKSAMFVGDDGILRTQAIEKDFKKYFKGNK